MKHKKTWIIVADGARAQVFINSGPGSGLESALPQALVADNRPSGDIGSDRPGRSFDSAGQGRHSMQPSSDPHQYAQAEFARDIAKLLEEKRGQKAYDQIIIIAAPKMLGELRSALDPSTSRLVVGEIDKDLTKLAVEDLSPHLDELIRL